MQAGPPFFLDESCLMGASLPRAQPGEGEEHLPRCRHHCREQGRQAELSRCGASLSPRSAATGMRAWNRATLNSRSPVPGREGTTIRKRPGSGAGQVCSRQEGKDGTCIRCLLLSPRSYFVRCVLDPELAFVSRSFACLARMRQRFCTGQHPLKCLEKEQSAVKRGGRGAEMRTWAQASWYFLRK